MMVSSDAGGKGFLSLFSGAQGTKFTYLARLSSNAAEFIWICTRQANLSTGNDFFWGKFFFKKFTASQLQSPWFDLELGGYCSNVLLVSVKVSSGFHVKKVLAGTLATLRVFNSLV